MSEFVESEFGIHPYFSDAFNSLRFGRDQRQLTRPIWSQKTGKAWGQNQILINGLRPSQFRIFVPIAVFRNLVIFGATQIRFDFLVKRQQISDSFKISQRQSSLKGDTNGPLFGLNRQVRSKIIISIKNRPNLMRLKKVLE